MRPGLALCLLLLACGPSSPAPDASSPDASTPDAGLPRCTESATTATCARETLAWDVRGERREVHFQVPPGAPPAAGWPTVIVFQGSFLGADPSWDATAATPFGGLHQARLTKALLEAGFAVVTPEARGDGSTYWDTNIPPYAGDWESSFDHALMGKLLAELAAGTFGPVDAARRFATGISSGGYMSSRMALSYPGAFRALAIHSASWATCGGALCVLPSALPAGHPPTLFLHGDADLVVPLATMTPYADALEAAGVHVERFVRPLGHAWHAEAPRVITDFFLAR